MNRATTPADNLGRVLTEGSTYWPEDLQFLWDHKLTRNEVGGLSAIRGFYYQCLYSLRLFGEILSDRITEYLCEVPEDFTTWSLDSGGSVAELCLVQVKTSLPQCFLADAARVRKVLKTFLQSLKALGPDVRPRKLEFRLVVNRHAACTDCERRSRVRQRRALSSFVGTAAKMFDEADVTINFEHFLPIPAAVSDFTDVLDFLRKDEPELLAFLQASENAKAFIQNLVGMLLPYHTGRTGGTLRDSGREPLSLLNLKRGRSDSVRELRPALSSAMEQARRISRSVEHSAARRRAAEFAQREWDGRRAVKTTQRQGAIAISSEPRALQALATIQLLREANVPGLFDGRQLRLAAEPALFQIFGVPAAESVLPVSGATSLSHTERLQLILSITRTLREVGRAGLSFSAFRAAVPGFEDLYGIRRSEGNPPVFVVGDAEALRVWDGEQSLLNPEWVRGSFVADILRYVYYGAVEKTAISRARASSNSWTDNLISDIADSLDKRYVRTDDLCDELAGVFEDDLSGWPLFFVDVHPDFVRDVVDAGLDRGSAAVLQVDADRLLSDRGPYSGRVLYVFSGTAQIALLPRSENLLSLYRYNPYITRRWERRRDRDLAASVKLAPPPGRARSRVVLVGVAHRAIIPELLKNVFGLRTDEYDEWLRDTLGAADENHVPLPPLLEDEERLLLARRQRLDLLSDPGVPFKLRSDEEGELLPGTRAQLYLRSDHRLSTRLQRLNYTHLDRRSGLSIRATDNSGRALTGSLEQCVSADTQEYLDVDIKSVEPGFEEAGTCRVVDEGCDAVIRSEETLLRDLYFGLPCGSVEVPALRAWRLLEPFAGVDVLGERSNATLWSGKMRAPAIDECHIEEQTDVTLYEEMFGGANGRPPIQVLTGAPGTGKTRVAATLADLFLSRNRDRAYPPARVLVVAASHFAIDNFLRTFRALASVDARIYRHVPPARVDQLRNSRVLDAVLHDEIAQEWERHRSELPPVRARNAERVNLNEYVASLETNIARLPVSGGNGPPLRRAFIPSHERWRKAKNGECSWLSEREPHFQRSYLVSKRDEFSKLRDGGDAAIREETRSDRLYRQFAADIVASTPDAFDRLPDLHYDLVVFEEASQLTGLKLLKVMTKVLRPLERDTCPRILLSGDRAQLPPFLETFSDAGEAADPESNDRFWSLLEEYRILQGLRTKETIFDRICDRASVKTLRVQRRMHPQIACLINSLFYSEQQWCFVGNRDPAGGVLWLDTSLKQAKPKKQGASLYNQAEIDAIREFVNGISDSDDRVLVIAPYAAQVRMLIRDLGASVTVRTIDGCQGIEADIVVVSFVSLRLTENSRFVVEPRRMNVAMSRARTRLVLVGDFQSLDAALRAAVGDPRLAHLSGLVELFGPLGPFGTCRRVLPA